MEVRKLRGWERRWWMIDSFQEIWLLRETDCVTTDTSPDFFWDCAWDFSCETPRGGWLVLRIIKSSLVFQKLVKIRRDDSVFYILPSGISVSMCSPETRNTKTRMIRRTAQRATTVEWLFVIRIILERVGLDFNDFIFWLFARSCRTVDDKKLLNENLPIKKTANRVSSSNNNTQ